MTIRNITFNTILSVSLLLVIPIHICASTEVVREEVGGLVIDRTSTRFGKLFYAAFCSRLRDVPEMNDTHVVITESPIHQSGTRLTVEVNNIRVFQTYLGRRGSSEMEELADHAVMLSAQHVTTRFTDTSQDLLGSGF